MKSKSKIPTDEEFARASNVMKEKARMLDVVREEVIRCFRNRCPLHDFFILDQRDVDFRCYIFFETNKDIEECMRNGIQDELTEFIYSELERVGRGKRDVIKVAFEFDSNENVKANFEGDYYLRLR